MSIVVVADVGAIKVIELLISACELKKIFDKGGLFDKGGFGRLKKVVKEV